MVERSDNFGSAGLAPADTSDAVGRADAWFAREILPLEASLMQFLQHNWRHKAEIADLRQEVYTRVYESALQRIPEKPKHFLFATARNLLIDRARQARVIPIDAASDLETLDPASDTPGPDQIVMARDELRRLQAALEKLSPRCREAVVLARIQGLSRREIAQRMGVTEGTAAQYLADGICALVEHLQRGGKAKP
ncbi:MAG TPA: RNA polymerase sigma factor [Rhizomicrobium sp.]|nr:RNA polymerase sigma factor [Rhizomicrobium sp.]